MELPTETRALDRRVVITALGIAQILAWGTSFYFPAVFAEPIVAETGWSLGWVVGGTSIGLLTAGLISPQVGRVIDMRGGRPVLLASSTFYAAGLAGVGLAPALPVYLFAWVLIGIGMGTGLYDAVFAALGRMYGSDARGPITNLTLFGGFASTICWPLSAFMIEHAGWRSACFIYAALHVFVSLPLQMAVVRAAPRADPKSEGGSTKFHRFSRVDSERDAHLCIAGRCAFDFSRHRLDRRRASADFSAGEGRRLRIVGRTWHVVRPGAGRRPRRGASLRQPLSSDLDHDCVLHVDGDWPAAAAWRSARAAAHDPALWRRLRDFLDRPGTLPLALFGPVRFPRLMGKLAFPSLIVQAFAPSVGALLIDARGSDCDGRCVDAACARQRDADRPVMGALPQALY